MQISPETALGRGCVNFQVEGQGSPRQALMNRQFPFSERNQQNWKQRLKEQVFPCKSSVQRPSLGTIPSYPLSHSATWPGPVPPGSPPFSCRCSSWSFSAQLPEGPVKTRLGGCTIPSGLPQPPPSVGLSPCSGHDLPAPPPPSSLPAPCCPSCDPTRLVCLTFNKPNTETPGSATE